MDNADIEEVPIKTEEDEEEEISINNVSYQPEELYEIEEFLPENNSKFNVTDRHFTLKINEVVNQASNVEEVMANVFDHVVKQLGEGETHLGLELTHPTASNSIRLPVMPLSRFSGNMLLNEIGMKMQSANFDFPLTDSQLQMRATFATTNLNASGRRKKCLKDLLFGVKSGKVNKATWSSTLTKVPGSNMCLPKCFALGILYSEMQSEVDPSSKQRKRRRFENAQREHSRRDLTDLAEGVLIQAQIVKRENYNVEDVHQLQSAYPQYQIICFDEDARPLFNGPPVTNTHNVIAMVLERGTNGIGHFWHIKKMSSFMGNGYYCNLCKVVAGSSQGHYNCPLMCQLCGYRSTDGNLKNCEGDVSIKCGKCNRRFNSNWCFENHKEKGQRGGKSWCEISQVCPDCFQIRSNKKEHKCFHRFCFTCQTERTKDHKCTIARVPPPPKEHLEVKVVLDAETCLYDKEYRGKMYPHHMAMMIIALRSCIHCRDQVPKDVHSQLECHHCGTKEIGFKRIKVFECFEKDISKNTVTRDFVEWSRKHTETTFIAHNFRGFDGQLILKELEKTNANPQVVCSGRKIMSMKVGSNRFIDSLNILPMKLAAFPKAFGITELAKGHFPHLINRPENFDMPIGELPPKECYGIRHMSLNEQKEFFDWYAKQVEEGVLFDFRKQLRDYCFSDVLLLSQGVHKFGIQFFISTNVRVFEETSTIASAAMRVYRRNFVPEGKISITKPTTNGIAQSHLASCYLSWYSKKNKVNVQHKYNGGEYRIPGTKFYADGFIHPTVPGGRGKILEVFGCFFHLHGYCGYGTTDTVHGLSWANVKTRDLRKKEAIEPHHDLIIVWECEIRKQLKQDKEMAEYFKRCSFESEVDQRESFFGGRTEVFKLKMEKDDEDTVLGYYDFCSLYPWTNKYGSYPVGEPINLCVDNLQTPIATPDELDVVCKGLMRCKVLPPRNLLYPVLPYRERQTLLFGLCRVCMETSQKEKCTHTVREREIVATWTTIELRKAVSLGYVITKIYAAQHWNEWFQYDKNKSPGDPSKHGPFSEYIDFFVKLKTEASGFPDWAQTREQREEFVAKFLELEGISLDYDKIEKNLQSRGLSKLLLNALWGKLGMRLNLPEILYITDPNQFWMMLDNSDYEIRNIEQCGMEMLRLEVCKNKSSDKMTLNVPPYLNVVYAAITTSLARLRLYEAMEKIPLNDLAYTDTDSLVFKYRKSKGNPLQSLIGDCLGMLTDEIPSNHTMTCFVAQGPKCYAYTLESADNPQLLTVCKCRGFRQTAEATQFVNFNSIAEHVEQLANNDEVQVISVVYPVIQNTGTRELFNVDQIKRFDARFGKRRIVENYDTVPFGYFE